jgi:hypothetical protein
VVGELVTQSQRQQVHSPSFTNKSSTVSNHSLGASVPGLDTVVNQLFGTPIPPVGSPLADDVAIAEMATGDPLRCLNFGMTDHLQRKKHKATKFVPFKYLWVVQPSISCPRGSSQYLRVKGPVDLRALIQHFSIWLI